MKSRSFRRREFLQYTTLGTLGLLGFSALAAKKIAAVPQGLRHFDGEDIFQKIVDKAVAQKWTKLPVGELMGKIARELEGTPYVGFTLETSLDNESCVVNLKGLDCVTFFEDTLDMARMLKRGGRTPADMLAEIQYTRYRGGKMGDFTSRLHYTTDWMVDNQKKGVVKILAPTLPGAEPFTQKVGIMSEKSSNYRQLKAHPELVPAIKRYEDEINSYNLKFIPLDKIEAAEPHLKTGDIIGVATREPGIDIAHTGLCIRDDAGVIHFMDASSSKAHYRVTFEPGPLHRALHWSQKLTGAMFARPLEVS
jgi:hypothetical protein